MHCADRKELMFNVKALDILASIDLFKNKLDISTQRTALCRRTKLGERQHCFREHRLLKAALFDSVWAMETVLYICKYEASITKLKKLQYLRVGTAFSLMNPSSVGGAVFKLPKLRTCCQVAGVKDESVLTALHTLGVVNVGGGAAILKELMDLTQLRKLGVSGVSKSNIKEFCSAVSNHSHLHSLSVWHNKYRDSLLKMPNECSPPKRLQSLKLYGLSEKLPGWMRQLVTLRKLNLDIDMLSQEDIEILGILPELCILRLRVKPLPPSGQLNFCLRTAGVEDRFYNKVKVLEIACCSSSIDVIFGSASMQRLELLRVGCFGGSVLKFADLRGCLRELKEVHIVQSPDGALDLEEKLINHPRQPTLKHLEMTGAVQFPFPA
ncbi:hypothetical protein PR202_gb23503 [Eleusine coracana subsp. coracana]|uniref:Disease resistance R13L4/SHOC-2-like LRR domain-containing protein n=1 Tax=Eleusine coracana subsp. coracana TaxID=191504 RepID=A0AAV5FJ50_ELECO|nr:hypothetical protein PR202_gb23503 [Eleusine coracana subsp. coracana]